MKNWIDWLFSDLQKKKKIPDLYFSNQAQLDLKSMNEI